MEGIKDWQKFRPWIFAIESTLPNTMTPSHEEWEGILTANDYFFVTMFGVNRFYIDMEREYLLQGFGKINEFVTQNELFKMTMQRLTFK